MPRTACSGAGKTTALELTSFIRGSKLPIEDKKTIAEIAVKLSEDHEVAHPAHDLRKQIATRSATLSSIGHVSCRSSSGSLTPIRRSAARLTEARALRRSKAATQLTTYKAYSGERFQTSGLVLIMPRPSNAKYLAETAVDQGARKKTRAICLFKLDELKAISTYWNNVPR